MARIKDGRLFPTFLPTSPRKEKRPNWEEIIEDLAKLRGTIKHTKIVLNQYQSRQSTSISQNKNERHDATTSEVSKNLYEEFSTTTIQPIGEQSFK